MISHPAPAYRRPPARPGDLKLDSNEGALPPAALLRMLAGLETEVLRRYPDMSTLEATLAERFSVARDRVIVTAGADEAIDRTCRAYLGPGLTLLRPEPSFEMLDRFAALAGGEVARVPWAPGPFPLAEFLARLDARTAVIAVVSPNNPTGGVASAGDVRRLAEAAPGALVLLDHAYVEYADEDLTSTVGDLPNVLVLRTLSKAWGLAGCRVGIAIGSPKTIAVLRAAGGPYPVAAPSAALALAQLAGGDAALREHVARVRDERRVLTERLAALGLQPWPSQANFVFAQCGPRPPAPFLAAGLAALGVIVRDFPDRPGLEGALRVTLPGDAASFTRLVTALDTVLAPQALLLHFDGALSPDRALLERLAARRLAIVTGRRADLGTQRAWMVGSTPDDVRAAAGAGVLPLALVAPGDDPAATAATLREAGAARVLDGLTDLLELLP